MTQATDAATTLVPAVTGPEVRGEVWVFMGDPTGLYLVSETPGGLGGPWLTPPIRARYGQVPKGAYHLAVHQLVARHGEDPPHVLHSTGWRPTDWGLALPYIAIVGEAGGYGATTGRLTFAYDAYPWGPGVGSRKVWEMGARPVGKPLYDDQGGPRPHGATEQPVVRDLDQVWNCLEHARHLRDYNAWVRAALDRWWTQGLEDWHGVLGGTLYDSGTWVEGREVA